MCFCTIKSKKSYIFEVCNFSLEYILKSSLQNEAEFSKIGGPSDLTTTFLGRINTILQQKWYWGHANFLQGTPGKKKISRTLMKTCALHFMLKNWQQFHIKLPLTTIFYMISQMHSFFLLNMHDMWYKMINAFISNTF